MKTFAVIAGLAALVQTALSQGGPVSIVINTPPSYVQCQPVALTFSGGVAPYYLLVLPGGQPSAAPLEQLPTQAAAGTYTWTVNLPAGTNITISITDSQGNINYNSARVILSSSDSSCLGTSATSASSGTSRATGTVTSAPVSTGSVLTTTLVSSAPSATVTASSGAVPTNVTTNNGTTVSPTSYNFTCSAGQGLLTYGITTATLRGVSLKQATAFFGNWTNAAPGTLVSSSGSGIGATRSWRIGGNITIAETLRTNQTNTTAGALHQQWNFTTAGPLALAQGLTVYNAFDDLTVYTNTTSNTTSVQYFVLACFNNQTLGLTALAQLIETSITQWTSNFTTPSARGRRAVSLF